MSERAAIEERLKKKRSEVSNLEDKLRTAKVYIAALEDVLRIFKDEGAPESDGDTKLRAGSSVAQAKEIILARGEPVHIDDLLASMGKEVTRDSKASLASSLAAYVRRQEIFSRTGPNTFGLIELDHSEEADEPEAPPPQFGTFADDLDDDIPF